MKKIKSSNVLSLKKEYRRIKENHRKAILKRVAKVCLGSSTVRVFKHSSQIKERLQNIDVEELLKIQSEGNFKKWFENELDKLTKVIPKTTSRSKKITDGARKWGYGAKILNLFLRDIIFHHRYFTEKDANRIQYFLYVPLDSILIERLFKLGEQLSFKRIKDIDTPEKFYTVQDRLKHAAREVGVPRIWFDDNWVDRQ
jgi:hypothetical protein